MKQLMDCMSVGTVGQRLFDQTAQAAKIAFETAQLQSGFLMFQAGHGEAQAHQFTEARK